MSSAFERTAMADVQSATSTMGAQPGAQTGVQPEAEPAESTSDVGVLRRWASLLVTAYLLLYYLPFPLPAEMFRDGGPLDGLITWFAAHTLGLAGATRVLRTGSGDTRFHYASDWLYLAISLLISVIALRWASAPRVATLVRWRNEYLRLALGGVLLSYGVSKVVPHQFGVLESSQVIEPLGTFTPAGLVWAFMAVSTPYQQLSGWLEVIPALLLLYRPTSRAGAALAVPVLANVVALNLLFDVPVKQYSLHLLGTALLLTPIRRLWLAVRGAAMAPSEAVRWPSAVNIAGYLATAFVVLKLLPMLTAPYRPVANHPYAGIWDVVDRSTAAPRWQTIAIGAGPYAQARLIGDDLAAGAFAIDRAAGTVTVRGALRDKGPSLRVAAADSALTLSFRAEHDLIWLAGEDAGTAMTITLKRRADQRPRLHARPFRWIQEYPEIR